ncbi:putative GNAT family N-acyltransferase [Breznakia sp. PF5-3]|uniref:GNAT family N-acetyltransferase n=1 Tax=unclassified Breznakia TaxID=2623764 RepID=UPI0024071867|nr:MULTISPECIES: GNAT family N-acetyltransferase [unclassified Breznakia]MDF9825097.1 putative GNAT family N-acyltransferase [Breznakia sp. PM6-1]MDF9835926.1 putative GNAT family N-acyltransferase [Breznakia sp. PF5-3]MDF9837472.1 putative GNAT family N-acyltransferase [Breznakia sp. PFB2-8]MDF9859465.1 putative GNAT family N-acyltransferase [Breznakia sp. PH5-24]
MRFTKATTQFEYFSLMEIRIKVFVKEQCVDPLIELDEEDKTCNQYLVYSDNKPIATCRVIRHGTTWHVGRVAVLKEFRNKHCGSFMLKEIEKIAHQEQAEKLVLGAQTVAIPFYEKNGFIAYGDIYLDADIEHRMMEKIL